MLINHIGISGGKDSTALMLWIVNESGYDKNSLDFSFCDTGNEHKITYDYILQPTFDFITRAIDFAKDEETHNCQSGFCE